jgi:hypothetical protein
MVAAAARVQYPGRLVQQERDVRPGVCLQGLSGSSPPSLGLVELTRPDQRAGQHYQRGGDHRLRAPKSRNEAGPLGRSPPPITNGEFP